MATALRTGYSAFRESYLSADAPLAAEFGSIEARRLRYDLLWAAYENTAYRDIHTYARKMRADLGLYRYTRGIHNPAFRLGEFYATHVWGGALDLEAGDGETKNAAIPILTDNEALRPAIGRLWRDSNWSQRKAIAPRWGSILGDVAIKPVDDPQRGRVYLDVIHPETLRDVATDAFGNVKAYVIEEVRYHPEDAAGRLWASPRAARRTCTYTEIVTRDGDMVVYETYLNGEPYDWTMSGADSAWAIPYGFVPLVLVQHLNVGLDWGWSEMHAGMPKFREADDLASKLHDQIRKTVDVPWFYAGVTKPTTTPSLAPSAATTSRPEPGREEIPAIYTPNEQAKATPLVAPLDIGAVAARIGDIIAELREDYPELATDIATSAGDASGRALRVARQRTTTRVNERRESYDSALVKAQQMAIAIGGFRGYDGYAGFGLDSYAAGALDHAIGERPVFAADPLDSIELESAFWAAAKAATEAGYDLRLYLADQGWDEQRLTAFDTAKAEKRQIAMQIAQPSPIDPTPTPGGNQADAMQQEMTNADRNAGPPAAAPAQP